MIEVLWQKSVRFSRRLDWEAAEMSHFCIKSKELTCVPVVVVVVVFTLLLLFYFLYHCLLAECCRFVVAVIVVVAVFVVVVLDNKIIIKMVIRMVLVDEHNSALPYSHAEWAHSNLGHYQVPAV